MFRENKTKEFAQVRANSVAPQVRLELTTLRLTAECSAIELLRKENREWEQTYPFPAIGIRRRPTLPGRYQPSTIGARRLNFCVRDGNRWDPPAIATGKRMLFSRFRAGFARARGVARLCGVSSVV